MTSSRFKIYTQTLLHHLRALLLVKWCDTSHYGRDFQIVSKKPEGFSSETALDDEPV